MLKNIVIILFIALAGFAAYVAMQPGAFTVTRSATFAATPDMLFDQINDLSKWEKWSPWAEMDPSQKMSYSGPVAGEGASMGWEGKETGVGTMTITSSQPNELIKMKLVFKKPMEGEGDITFAFVPEGDKTKLTWTHTGVNDFMGKAFDIVMNVQKCLGEQFEKGFENLRKLVEA